MVEHESRDRSFDPTVNKINYLKWLLNSRTYLHWYRTGKRHTGPYIFCSFIEIFAKLCNVDSSLKQTKLNLKKEEEANFLPGQVVGPEVALVVLNQHRSTLATVYCESPSPIPSLRTLTSTLEPFSSSRFSKHEHFESHGLASLFPLYQQTFPLNHTLLH